ncbi:hypothetical protein RUM43_003197 [Polyplax serrata]|uniref:Uncharacterized protein n=1 Tax=Polyplax serrata TaxID=468196 RepID=A0AAN8P311_POLSC
MKRFYPVNDKTKADGKIAGRAENLMGEPWHSPTILVSVGRKTAQLNYRFTSRGLEWQRRLRNP